MIRSNIFVRFSIIGAIVSVIFLFISVEATHLMRNLIFEEPFREGGPFTLVRDLVGKLPPEERSKALNENHQKGPHFIDYYLSDDSGKILYPQNYTPEEQTLVTTLVHSFPAVPPNLENNRRLHVYKLPGTPEQFFVRSQRPRPPPPPLEDRNFILMMVIQVTTIIAAVLATLGILIYSLRSQAKISNQVIKELTHGNLKARFPVTKMDEIGQVMFSFNKMADEIERLVENLKKTESTRRDLLRELAHDLRTPIASMKSFIETVRDRSELTTDKRTELLSLAYKESDYFEGLVNDLLFLGRVQEPSYKSNLKEFRLDELIMAEVGGIQARYNNVRFRAEFSWDGRFTGDVDLIKRMLRNGIENAFSFAKSEVSITLNKTNDNLIEIKIADDGPGFTDSALESFGQRKYSRTSDKGSDRISIGLGSVIMKSVVDAYRGQLYVYNRVEQPGNETRGAEVQIILPT